jgi:peptidoglycan hydrolase-like protein with peptidoglycan-binding domain
MLEDFKGILIGLVILATIGLLGFWAFKTLEPGDISASRQKQAELEKQNKDLLIQLEVLKNQVAELEQAKVEAATPVVTQPEPEKPVVTKPTTYKNQALINELQKLITDKVNMKEGSKGTRVGTVQKFLNIYNGTKNKIDNDFGATMKKVIITYHKAVGLPADGQAGASTFQKMIDWLKKQG